MWLSSDALHLSYLLCMALEPLSCWMPSSLLLFVFQNCTDGYIYFQVAPNDRQRNNVKSTGALSNSSSATSMENSTSGSVRVVPKVKLTHSRSKDGSLLVKARANGSFS